MSIEQSNKILAFDVTTSLSGKAPTSHASTNTTYGIGTGSNYGHVKLSDSTLSTSDASAGIAASPKAVKAAYDKAVEAANSAGTVRSVNGVSADEAGNVAISSVSTATTATKATTTPNVVTGEVSGNSFTLPSGGTWKYMTFTHNDVYVYSPYGGTAAGGTTVTRTGGYPVHIIYIAIRVS